MKDWFVRKWNAERDDGFKAFCGSLGYTSQQVLEKISDQFEGHKKAFPLSKEFAVVLFGETNGRPCEKAIKIDQ